MGRPPHDWRSWLNKRNNHSEKSLITEEVEHVNRVIDNPPNAHHDQLSYDGIYFAEARRYLTRGKPRFCRLTCKLIIPAVIIQSFCVDFSVQKLKELVQSALVALLLLGVAIFLARLLYPKAPLENFSAAFSNAGFMGIPLVRAVLGNEAVFYIVPFVALLNLLQWTYGVDVICQSSTKRTFGALCKNLFLNPPMVAIGIGLAIYLSGSGTMLPTAVTTTLQGICALNTLLAMMVLGVYLAKEKIITLFTSPALYGVCFVRLLFIPLSSLGILYFLPFPQKMEQAILICAAAPAGANVAVYAQLYKKNYAYASKIVVLSTIFSLLCLPAIAALSQLLL